MENKDKSELPIIKHTPEYKLFNYLCEIGVIPIDTEVHEIRLIVYEELGLSGIENPREWVEKINQSAAILPLMEGMINFLNDVKNEGKSFTSRINMLENENDAVDIVLWACPADVAGNPIQRIMDLANERNQLQSEITKLQSELKQSKAAKAEAWDEGLKSGKNYVESSMSCDEGVRLPENPYKPDFNQNSMFERFGDLEQEFKVE